MEKTGNANSPLLNSFMKAAKINPKKEVEFDINEILQNKPKGPTLQEIFADVMKRTGKNITRTAQFGMKPMPEEPGVEEPLFDDVGGIEPGLGEEPGLGGEPGMEPGLGEPGMEEPGDLGTDSAKQHIVDALVEMCGGVQEAADCIMQSTSPEGPEGALSEPGDPILDDEGMDEGLLDEDPMDEVGAIEEDIPDKMPAPMMAPSTMPM